MEINSKINLQATGTKRVSSFPNLLIGSQENEPPEQLSIINQEPV